MCDVTAAIALGSAVAGSALQSRGAAQAQKAEAGVAAAERGRQDGYRRTAMNYVDTAREGASRPALDAGAASAAAGRAASLRTAGQVPAAQGGYLPGMESGPQSVRDEVDRQRGLASAFVGQQGDARAALGGWGDAMQASRTGIARSGQGVATEAGFARGSADAMPAEITAAGSKGSGTRMLGDLVAGGGNLAAATYGGAKGWGSLFSAAPVAAPALRRATTGRVGGPV